MSELMMAGLVAGVVLAVILVVLRRVQTVLLPVLLVLGIAGLSLVVTWQKEEQRQARAQSDAALYAQADAGATAAPGNAATLPPPLPNAPLAAYPPGSAR